MLTLDSITNFLQQFLNELINNLDINLTVTQQPSVLKNIERRVSRILFSNYPLYNKLPLEDSPVIPPRPHQISRDQIIYFADAYGKSVQEFSPYSK